MSSAERERICTQLGDARTLVLRARDSIGTVHALSASPADRKRLEHELQRTYKAATLLYQSFQRIATL